MLQWSPRPPLVTCGPEAAPPVSPHLAPTRCWCQHQLLSCSTRHGAWQLASCQQRRCSMTWMHQWCNHKVKATQQVFLPGQGAMGQVSPADPHGGSKRVGEACSSNSKDMGAAKARTAWAACRPRDAASNQPQHPNQPERHRAVACITAVMSWAKSTQTPAYLASP
jgi:hypothetical protein